MRKTKGRHETLSEKRKRLLTEGLRKRITELVQELDNLQKEHKRITEKYEREVTSSFIAHESAASARSHLRTAEWIITGCVVALVGMIYHAMWL